MSKRVCVSASVHVYGQVPIEAERVGGEYVVVHIGNSATLFLNEQEAIDNLITTLAPFGTKEKKDEPQRT